MTTLIDIEKCFVFEQGKQNFKSIKIEFESWHKLNIWEQTVEWHQMPTISPIYSNNSINDESC